MGNDKFCGKIDYNTKEYSVFWDIQTEIVSISRTNDEKFGIGAYSGSDRFKANNKIEALEVAKQMLEMAGE